MRGINERWTGVRLEHVARCAAAAARDGTRVGVIVLAVTALALKAAGWHADRLWAAAAVGLASLTAALTAAWRRREGWAFLAVACSQQVPEQGLADAHQPRGLKDRAHEGAGDLGAASSEAGPPAPPYVPNVG